MLQYALEKGCPEDEFTWKSPNSAAAQLDRARVPGVNYFAVSLLLQAI